MAYADTIRAATATFEQTATLIEGIASSTYPLTWAAFSPTYGASGSMTYTTVTTTTARYVRIGKLVFFILDAVGTTGGVASDTITFTLPVTAATQNHGIGGQVYQSGYRAGVVIVSNTTGSILKYDNSNYSLAASTYIRACGIYEAA